MDRPGGPFAFHLFVNFYQSFDRFLRLFTPIPVRAKKPEQRGDTPVYKLSFANRFGLVASFFVVSLFPTTSAWAQKTAAASGTQPVVVTNTAAQPVPVTVPKTQFYQATQTLPCIGESQIPYTFSVPSGKTLIVRSV